MSLPSRAIIRNAAGEKIDSQPVNCGWSSDLDSIARTAMYHVQNKGFVATDTMELYSVKFPLSYLIESKSIDDFKAKIEPIFNKAVEEFKSVAAQYYQDQSIVRAEGESQYRRKPANDADWRR